MNLRELRCLIQDLLNAEWRWGRYGKVADRERRDRLAQAVDGALTEMLAAGDRPGGGP